MFILLSRESDGGTIFWTKPHPLRSCPFPRFPVVSLTSYHSLNLLLVRSHQADIIIVKRLIQGRNNVYMRVGVERFEPRSRDCDHTVAIKVGLYRTRRWFAALV